MDNLKILIVDDDQVIRLMLEIALESAGYQVVIAEDGNEAIAALHNEKFDLVITDLQMGDPDGFAVLREAKKMDPLIRRIVMTGSQDESSVITAIKIGVEAYLQKPFSLDELLHTMGKCSVKLKLDRNCFPNSIECDCEECTLGLDLENSSHHSSLQCSVTPQ